ncbi:MAG TPA: UDP-N-acetylmuramoyl-tripeptide--D-alanyl-D-alanine ligase [Steroidobacteraceae bacterium]|nr:UDP-N-acetylmuramoyl-tripeptide--D-alanyl-D-alanine ligase [Steroidobacteraceae bacterium]
MSALQFTTSCMATVVDGRLIGADVEFASVSTDSRTITKDALFVALQGPNFDGHEYLQVAKERGAVAALVSREVNVSLPQVLVPDVLGALSEYARVWRSQFGFPVIGVTGSNGKTTVKEMIGSIMKQLGNVLVTRGNLNNHIGVPLTLLELNAAHQSAVIEMGANHQREIAALAKLSAPNIGIVTNAGAAHLEGFGGMEGVAAGKGELYLALPEHGVAIINADDQYVDYWRTHCNAGNVLTFGMDSKADFSAKNIAVHGDHSQFELHSPHGSIAIRLNLAGTHNVRNAVGAAAAAYAAGATLEQIQEGLSVMRPVGGRLQIKQAINGAALIDDSYNANPSSMRAGIDALRSLSGKHWLVMGEMMELGADTQRLHADIGNYAKSHGIEKLFAVGALTQHAVNAFGNGALWFASVDALISAVLPDLSQGTTVLIKGSRSNRLERVAAALLASGETHATVSH